MGQFNKNRPPEHYPKCLQDLFWKAALGGPGQEFRVFYKTFPGRGGRSSNNIVASFKASLRNYPLHPLAKYVDSIRTQTFFVNGLDYTEVFFIAWKVASVKHFVRLHLGVDE